jgi:hypothetical protein
MWVLERCILAPPRDEVNNEPRKLFFALRSGLRRAGRESAKDSGTLAKRAKNNKSAPRTAHDIIRLFFALCALRVLARA